MADSTYNSLQSMLLSAAELKEQHPDWSDVFIEDYLNIFRNFFLLSEAVDVVVAAKLEEIPTDFEDYSIPFVNSNLVVEDNTNFFWNFANEVLNVKNILLQNAIASRILATDASNNLESVLDLTDYVDGTEDQIVSTPSSGTAVLSLDDPLITPGPVTVTVNQGSAVGL